MKEFVLTQAMEDWGRFINIYNRNTVFAPYTVHLTEELIYKYIVPFCMENDVFAAIGVYWTIVSVHPME
jgi:hypothetical protein